MLYTYANWDAWLRTAPMRDKSQSTTTKASAAGAGGGRICSTPGRNRISSEIGSGDTTATVLPSRRRPHASASMEPRQSGSGSTWDVMTNDSWRSIACASRSSPSGPAIAILLAGAGRFRLDADLGRRVRAAGKRAQQPVDAVAPFNGIVELKGDLRRVPQADALAQLRANIALRVRQHRQRLLFLLLVAED